MAVEVVFERVHEVGLRGVVFNVVGDALSGAAFLLDPDAPEVAGWAEGVVRGCGVDSGGGAVIRADIDGDEDAVFVRHCDGGVCGGRCEGKAVAAESARLLQV